MDVSMYVVSIFSCLASCVKMDVERFRQSSSTMLIFPGLAICKFYFCFMHLLLLHVLKQNNDILYIICRNANIVQAAEPHSPKTALSGQSAVAQ